jgi:hypothetical protein
MVLALMVAPAIHAQGPGQQSPGQYPPTYPPSTNPPSTYPPSTYPPSNYPQQSCPTDSQGNPQCPNQNPSQYPNQNPVGGRVPISLPIPGIKLPKRGSNDDKSGKASSSQGKVNLRAVDGTLRELGEKDLYLEASNKKLFRFRILEKTQFRNKDGESIRDSLLKPGDQLSAQVNEDDPETAVRVVLSAKGTPSQREAASRPFDHDSAKAALMADTHPAGTMEVARNVDGAATSNPTSDRPTLKRPDTDAPADAPAASPKPTPASAPAPAPELASNPTDARRTAPLPPRRALSGDDVIDAARDAAGQLTDSLPNFIVQQETTRNYSTTFPARWKVMDVVSAEVVSVGGQEEYRNIMVNGKPTNRPLEKSGSWSTGEFVSTLADILSPATDATFRKSADDQTAGRPVYVYNFTVQQENSNWRIVAPDGRAELPGYSGSIWIDKETKNVLRIEERTGPMPASFPFDKAESTIDYAFVRMDGKTYVLPVESATLTCERGTSNCTRNDIRFQNYRKFEAKSSITFDK